MKNKILSGNALKLIAAASMLLDHIGLMFFPTVPIFRILGRLAFPIFAFMISEGARYTRNKLRYFMNIFSVAVLCQLVYFFFAGGSLYMCILVTFSLSVLLIYALQSFKCAMFSKDATAVKKIFSGAVFFGSVVGVYFLNEIIDIDYGFIGCVTPVFASLFDFKDTDAPEFCKRLDNRYARCLSMLIPLTALIIRNYVKATFYLPYTQVFSLLAIPLLLLYSEKRGKANLKYFFYLFYPIHLAALEGAGMILVLI